MTVRAPVGDIAINDQEVVIGGGICLITGSRFLYYNLEIKKLNNYWRKFSSGSTFESINSNDIKNSDIAIPYEAEQEKIGNLFKNIDQLIKNQEVLVEETTNFKKSMLQKMFPKKESLVPEIRFDSFSRNWKELILENISNQYDSLRKPIKENLRIKGIYPYYGAISIQDYVEEYIFDGEYILIAEDGASDIYNYPINYVKDKFWVNNHAHVIKANLENNTLFLNYAFNIVNFNKYLVGGTRKKLNASSLSKIELKIPSLEEQEKIGEFFKNLDEKIKKSKIYLINIRI